MRKIAIAAAFAALAVQPALAADSVTSTVATIDTKSRVIGLADRTMMSVGKDVNLDAVKPGMKVVVYAKLDEDGYAPATAIAPAN